VNEQQSSWLDSEIAYAGACLNEKHILALVDIKQYQYVSLIIFTVLLGTKGAHPV
jgi:hypothetical protein